MACFLSGNTNPRTVKNRYRTKCAHRQAAELATECLRWTSVSPLLIYQPPQRLAHHETKQIIGEEGIVPLPKFLSKGGHMRRNQAVVEIPIRRAGRQRLFLEDVESGTADLFPAKCCDESFVVD